MEESDGREWKERELIIHDDEQDIWVTKVGWVDVLDSDQCASDFVVQ